MFQSHLAKSLMLTLTIGVAGCNSEPTSRSSGTKNEPPPRGRHTPGAPVTRDEVIVPRESDGKVAVENYAATEGPYRLYGIDPGDGPEARGATIADVTTWSTRTYRVGEIVGRGLRVAAVGEHEVTLDSARGPLVLRPGDDVKLRVIRHKLDVVAEPLGRNFFLVDTEAAQAARSPLPIIEIHDLYDQTVLKLGPVAPGSLFAEADFREGDLVAAVDGEPAHSGSLAKIHWALTTGQPRLKVRVIRAGVPMDVTFETKR